MAEPICALTIEEHTDPAKRFVATPRNGAGGRTDGGQQRVGIGHTQRSRNRVLLLECQDIVRAAGGAMQLGPNGEQRIAFAHHLGRIAFL